MKIYEVTGYDSGGPTTYYEPTKRAAELRKRAMKQEADDWDEIEIKPMIVEPTRVGIAKALQYVIHLTCANEH
jgi:hypothetical protein